MQSTFIYLFTSTLKLSYSQLCQSSDVEKAALTGRPVLTIVSDNRQISCTVQLLNASTTALLHRIYISVTSSSEKGWWDCLPVSSEYFHSPPQLDCFSKQTTSRMSLFCFLSLLKWYKTDMPLGPAPITQTRFPSNISDLLKAYWEKRRSQIHNRHNLERANETFAGLTGKQPWTFLPTKTRFNLAKCFLK